MYLFETDADTPPTEREGEYKLSVYLTRESRPRQVPSGHTGLYEATVPESEAEMKNYPNVQTHIRDHRFEQKHIFDRIEVTIDGTVRDKATGRIVALRPEAVQRMAHDFAETLPEIQEQLSIFTHLDKNEQGTFLNALFRTRKDIKSLAGSIVHRMVHFDIDLNDVESVRPTIRCNLHIGKRRTINMESLGKIPVTFFADYSRMGGGE
jgi:hypothetical protein